MKDTLKTKIISTFVIFCLMFGIILIRAIYIQVIDKEKLINYSNSQIVRKSIIYPNRGDILDRNGEPLAINMKTYSLFTIPKNISNFRIYKKLVKIIPTLSYKKISEDVKRRKKYTWIARKIPLNKEQVNAVKKLKGIYIESVPKRYYPNHELLSQVIGFVGMDNVGLAGIEHSFNKTLKGRPLILKYHKDAKGRAVRYETKSHGEKAKDVVLTIDKQLQIIVEKYLKEGVLKYDALRGGAGVLDTSSGEILAIANYPTFDPNEFRYSSPDSRKLSFISDPIEPGSIFKILTVASALEHKVARPDTSYYCEQGQLKVEDHIISEAESKKVYEWLTVEEILKLSSNIGTTKIAFDLTYPRLKKTLEDFNIGSQLGIQISGESRGIFNLKKENVSPLSLSNISFGQGVATTGIQMLAAYGAIANGGVYNYPTIIKGESVKKSYRVISEKTSKELSDMLEKVVVDGTGTRAQIPYFRIAGKTSTAQRPNRKGSYEGYIPGFIGYPLNVKNRFVVFVYIEKPTGKVYYGNSVAAPVFKKIAQYILYKDKAFSSIDVAETKVKRDVIDSVVIKSQTRKYNQNIIPGFIGLDKRSSINLAKKLSIKLIHYGVGVVAKQSPLSGESKENDQVVKLHYKMPSYE